MHLEANFDSPKKPGKPANSTSAFSLNPTLMLLLLLSRFSRFQLCTTPETAAHQAPPSLGFSRQEHWSGLPFPSPMHESEVTQSCPTLSDPIDCSLPGSSFHGIFQARVLEWGAIAFSESYRKSPISSWWEHVHICHPNFCTCCHGMDP